MHRHRIDEVEILRAISFLAIVMQHTLACFMYNPGIQQGSAAVSAFLLIAIRYGVPVFIFITGLVLFYNHGEEEIHYWGFIEKRFTQILIPYFLWTLFYYVWLALTAGAPPSSIAAVLGRIAEMTLKGTSFYHLWFIVMILQFYLLFPLLQRLVLKSKNHPVNFLAACFALYLLYIWVYQYQVGAIYEHVQSTLVRGLLDYRDRIFTSWFLYFLLGGFAGLYIDKWRSLLREYWKVYVPVFIAIFAYIMYLMIQSGQASSAGGYVINYQLTLPLTILMVVFLTSSILLTYYLSEMILLNTTRLCRAFKYIGRYSYGGYFIHPLVLFYVNAFAQANLAPLGTITQILVSFVICSALSILLCIIISKIQTPWGNSLVGKISAK